MIFFGGKHPPGHIVLRSALYLETGSKGLALLGGGLDLQLALGKCHLAASLAPDVRWGISLQGAEASLLPQNATLSHLVFLLNDSGVLESPSCFSSKDRGHYTESSLAFTCKQGPTWRRQNLLKLPGGGFCGGLHRHMFEKEFVMGKPVNWCTRRSSSMGPETNKQRNKHERAKQASKQASKKINK